MSICWKSNLKKLVKPQWELTLWRILTLLESPWSVAAKLFSLKRGRARRGRARYGLRLPSVEDTKALTLLSLRTEKTDASHGPVGSKGAREAARDRAEAARGVRRRPAI